MLPFNLIKEVFIGSSEDNSASIGVLASFEEDEIIVSNSSFSNEVALSQEFGIEYFFSFRGSHSSHEGSTCEFGNSLEISLLDSSQSQNTSSDHILRGSIINAHSSEDDIGSGFNDFVDSALEDVAFFKSDLFEIFRIIDEDLDAELQSEFVKIEIQACDLGFGDIVRHVLMGFNGLNSVSSDELTFSAALSVGFKDIDGFDIILNL